MSFNSLTDTTPESPLPVRAEVSSERHLIAVLTNDVASPLAWLEKECPGDIVPKVLAFCGPQQVAALSKTNKHWNTIVRQERTWRVMCEELYKVRRRAEN